MFLFRQISRAELAKRNRRPESEDFTEGEFAFSMQTEHLYQIKYAKIKIVYSGKHFCLF